jgi:WD40 repeat protein
MVKLSIYLDSNGKKFASYDLGAGRKVLASASHNNSVKLWDAGSGTVLQTLEGYSYSVS